MKNILCDLFLLNDIDLSKAKNSILHINFSLTILSRINERSGGEFISDITNVSIGYWGVDVKRIKLAAYLMILKNRNIECTVVPIQYRDNINLSKENCEDIATIYAINNDLIFVPVNDFDRELVCFEHPMYFQFKAVYQNSGMLIPFKNGIIVDKLDGHIWTNDEYEEYMYDCNNILEDMPII